MLRVVAPLGSLELRWSGVPQPVRTNGRPGSGCFRCNKPLSLLPVAQNACERQLWRDDCGDVTELFICRSGSDESLAVPAAERSVDLLSVQSFLELSSDEPGGFGQESNDELEV